MWKSQFSINVIGHMLIPYRHRQVRFVAWVKVFLSYLTMLKDTLYSWWDETLLDASMTPQVMYLERILNLMFQVTSIFIDEGYTLGPWIFLDTETPDPEFFMDQDDSYVYNLSDAIIVNFVVNIPSSLSSDTSRIAAIVHKYKLPGKSFIIQIFS
ncbi:MAG: hypothetical protein WCO44_12360 [Bacteroidota bacterium]